VDIKRIKRKKEKKKGNGIFERIKKRKELFIYLQIVLSIYINYIIIGNQNIRP
jgi:hypothetical protein